MKSACVGVLSITAVKLYCWVSSSCRSDAA